MFIPEAARTLRYCHPEYVCWPTGSDGRKMDARSSANHLESNRIPSCNQGHSRDTLSNVCACAYQHLVPFKGKKLLPFAPSPAVSSASGHRGPPNLSGTKFRKV